MVELIKGANLALRFLLELCALVALGYWGFKTGSGALAKIALGIGTPFVAAIVWGVFVAARAPVALPGVVVLLLQALVFGSAAAGSVRRATAGEADEAPEPRRRRGVQHP